jgi:type VI secretion system protein ImpH
MAGTDRTQAHALEVLRELQKDPYRFDFFHAVRCLENVNPAKPRIGQSLRPIDDAVRLGQEPSMAFAPSTLASFQPGEEGRPARLSTYFLGLFGPNGPLPLHLTEYARDRMRHSFDPTFSRFADIFHHRMLSLFYRAWADARPAVNFDRPDSDRFAVYVGSLFGIGMPALRDRDEFPDFAKLHYAGHFVCQTRHAEGLMAILADFFRLPLDVEEFVGQWLELPEDCLGRLGVSAEESSLGRSISVGSRTWDCQTKIRLRFGPLRLAEYEDLLPGGESLPRLGALVRNYVGDVLNWDLRLVLRKEDVPPLKLGGKGRLGWTTWLAGRPMSEDPSDLTLNPMAVSAGALQ